MYTCKHKMPDKSTSAYNNAFIKSGFTYAILQLNNSRPERYKRRKYLLKLSNNLSSSET